MSLIKQVPKKQTNNHDFKASQSKLSFISSGTTNFIKKNYILLEEEAFLEMLRDIIAIHKEAELLKNDIAVCNDFNLLDSFRYFQNSNRDFLYPADVKNGLKILEVQYVDEEVDYFVMRYDSNKNKVLSYNDFCNILMPFEKEYAELVKNRQYARSELYNYKNTDSVELMCTETKFRYCHLLKIILSGEMKVEIWREKLNKMRNFIIKNLFEKIDFYNNGFITEYDVSDYLNNNGIPHDNGDVTLLVNRFCKDGSGKVTYSQFANELFPKKRDFYLR